MTKYRVLVLTDGATFAAGDSWALLSGTYEGANDEAAIKAALSAGTVNGDPSGEYVAVPLRSWKPRKVEAKQAFSFS